MAGNGHSDKGNGKKRGRGRPTDYDPERTPELTRYLALGGKTEAEIARLLGVTSETIQEWQRVHPEYSVAIKGGRNEAAEQVEKSLFRRAMGYDWEETTVIGIPDEGGGMIVKEVRKVKKHEPPHPTALIFWLKNILPDKYRDVHHTALSVEKQPYADLTDSEVKTMYLALAAQGNGRDKGEGVDNEA